MCWLLTATLLGMFLLSTQDFVQIILFGKDILLGENKSRGVK